MTSWPAATLELDHKRSGSGQLLFIHRPRVCLRYFCLFVLIGYCESLVNFCTRLKSVAINNHQESISSARADQLVCVLELAGNTPGSAAQLLESAYYRAHIHTKAPGMLAPGALSKSIVVQLLATFHPSQR